MLGLFRKKHPELSMGLDHDDEDAVVEPVELPEYDPTKFEWEVEDENEV